MSLPIFAAAAVCFVGAMLAETVARVALFGLAALVFVVAAFAIEKMDS